MRLRGPELREVADSPELPTRFRLLIRGTGWGGWGVVCQLSGRTAGTTGEKIKSQVSATRGMNASLTIDDSSEGKP